MKKVCYVKELPYEKYMQLPYLLRDTCEECNGKDTCCTEYQDVPIKQFKPITINLLKSK